MAGVVLQLYLVMEKVLSSDPTRGSRHDFSFSRSERTTFVLLLYLGHMENLTGVITKVQFLLGYTKPERCLADQG